jgi:peptidoglycan/xylan/chitin deacetylase (PgdA/CDA1 family)
VKARGSGPIGALIHPPVALAYHGVSDAAASSGSFLLTDPAVLRSHIAMLAGRGYRFLTAEQLLADCAEPPPPRTAVLTFDDGWRDGLTTVAPILDELGVRATFYLNPGRWGGQHPDVGGESGRLLDEREAAELHARGMEIAPHSMTHANLTALADRALRYELEASKAAVEALTRRECRTFAYPFGLFDDRVVAAVADAGFGLAFTWRRGPWSQYRAPRIPAPTRRAGWALRLKMRGMRRPALPGS